MNGLLTVNTRKCFLLAAFLFSAQLCFAQSGPAKTELKTTNSQRTVAGSLDEIATQLQQMYGYRITFESPRYVYLEDLEDVTLKTRNDLRQYAPGKAPKVIVPRRNAWSVETSSSGQVDLAYVEGRLNEVIAAQNSSAAGAHFRVEREGDEFHILPTEVRNAYGEWVSEAPIMDTLISIPPGERSALDMISLIGKAVSSATKIEGGLMTAPLNALEDVRGTWGATDEPARKVLQRVLRDTAEHFQSGHKFGWLVGYVPAPETFGLNITLVPPRTVIGAMPSPARTDSSSGIALGPRPK